MKVSASTFTKLRPPSCRTLPLEQPLSQAFSHCLTSGPLLPLPTPTFLVCASRQRRCRRMPAASRKFSVVPCKRFARISVRHEWIVPFRRVILFQAPTQSTTAQTLPPLHLIR